MNDGGPTGADGTWQVICLAAAAAVMYLDATVRRPGRGRRRLFSRLDCNRNRLNQAGEEDV